MRLFNTTNKWKKYWEDRKIDWKESYQNWDHPHRFLITEVLRPLVWISLIEIGVGGGANLMNILRKLPGKQVGGVDISQDAIDLCNKTFKGGVFKVGSADDMMMSDKATDVLLSDMCLIYVDPFKIDKYIKEIKRVTRKYVVLCEFHSDSLWNRTALRINSGYNAYDYKKLLKKHGFYDIISMKVSEKYWPGGSPQKEFAYIILATVPKR